ncbi:MAG: TatD family hydrolase [Bordetella sp.]|nr:MAG: TatD family hydrolase [Bordetella sp.]
MYIDSHCHLNVSELRDDIPNILIRMKKNYVTHALVVSTTDLEWLSVISLVSNHKNLLASIGIHPCYVNSAQSKFDELCDLSKHPKVVAIGETGLDYSRLDMAELQRHQFRSHIKAANQTKLPLIVHTRSSINDVIKILNEERSKTLTGVMHCFTENLDFAQKVIKLNFFISLSGIVTFKNAHVVHEVARNIPLDRLLIETDSPFLSPEPYRGKINEPANVALIAEKIAKLRGISKKEVANISSENFFRLFNKTKFQ